jgi:hypothetical protein
MLLCGKWRSSQRDNGISGVYSGQHGESVAHIFFERDVRAGIRTGFAGFKGLFSLQRVKMAEKEKKRYE